MGSLLRCTIAGWLLLALPACRKAEQPVVAAASEAWPERAVFGLKLRAPFELGTAADITESIPEAVREMVLQSETSEGRDANGDLSLTVVHARYKDGLPVSVEGAAHGQVTNAAASIGDVNPDYKITPVTVSGNEARRTEYHRAKVGGETYLSCLVIRRRQELWQVQAFYTSRKSAGLAAGILESVTVEGK